MSESDFWGDVKIALHGMDPQRIENRLGLGTPDVNHSEGWVELKFLEKWPEREETIVSIDHYTAEQRVWHLRRHMAGGRVHLLLKVGREVLLFWAVDAADVLNKKPRADVLRAAVTGWSTKKSLIRGLKDAIRQPVPAPTLFDTR